MIPSRAIACWLALLLTTVAGPVAHAGSIFDTARSIPDDVDFLFVLDDAVSLRARSEGRHAEALLTSASSLSPLTATLRRQWNDLAEALAFNDAQRMFDELFGTQMVIASRMAPDGAQDTVLISALSEDMQARIRKRLVPVPRGVYGNYNILKPRDDENFSMVLDRRKGGATLYMSLTARDALLREVLDLSADNQAPRFADRDVIPELRALHRAPVAYAYVNARRYLPMSAQQWIAGTVAATQDDGRLELRFAGRLLDDVEHPSFEPFWSGAMYERWQRAAYVVMLGSSGIDNITKMLLGERLPIERIEQTAPRQILGMRRALVVTPGADNGPLDVTWASELRDPKFAARVGDAVVERTLVDLAPIDHRDDFRFGYSGIFPEAIRTADVSLIAEHRDPGAWAYGSTLAWTYRTSKASDAERSWLTIGLGTDLVKLLADDLAADEPEAPVRPHLSVGTIRLGALRRDLERQGLPMSGILDLLASRIEKVSWETHRTPTLIIGEAAIEFVGGEPGR